MNNWGLIMIMETNQEFVVMTKMRKVMKKNAHPIVWKGQVYKDGNYAAFEIN